MLKWKPKPDSIINRARPAWSFTITVAFAVLVICLMAKHSRYPLAMDFEAYSKLLEGL